MSLIHYYPYFPLYAKIVKIEVAFLWKINSIAINGFELGHTNHIHDRSNYLVKINIFKCTLTFTHTFRQELNMFMSLSWAYHNFVQKMRPLWKTSLVARYACVFVSIECKSV